MYRKYFWTKNISKKSIFKKYHMKSFLRFAPVPKFENLKYFLGEGMGEVVLAYHCRTKTQC